MQRACIAFSIYRPRKRSSNQRARPNPYRNHEPPGEPAHRWRSRPQHRRHCAAAHLHPRRQCRRRSTRCARTSRRLCAASRDLPLVLGHFRRFASSRRTRLLLLGGAAHAGLAARTRIRPADSPRSAAPGDRHARPQGRQPTRRSLARRAEQRPFRHRAVQ